MSDENPPVEPTAPTRTSTRGSTAPQEAPASEESAATPEAQETFQLAEEGFDVTQRPPSELDGKQVDYAKTTMPVTDDPATPRDFNPKENRSS